MIPLTADNILALTIQAGVLVLVGAPLPWLFGIRSPRPRLAYWRGLLVVCLLLPLLQPWLPEQVSALPTVIGPVEWVTAVAGPATGSSIPVAGGWPLRLEPLDVITAGMVARFAWFAFGLVTLRRLRRHARILEPRPASVDEARGLAGATAEFRVAPTTSRPVTFGLLRPVVVVPGDFADFHPGEQTAIACHELIHVRRRDWIRNVADEVVRAVAWFHPATWWLTRQIRLCREQLVDQEVVRRTGARKPYLDALLRLASPDRGSVLVPAPLFLGRTHLSQRVALLLKEVRMSRPRLVLSFVAMAAALSVAGGLIVAAVPLHAWSADTPALQGQAAGQQPAGAAQPGQMTRQPASTRESLSLRRIHDARPVFPAGSPDTPLLMSVKIDAGGAVTDVTTVSGPADLAALAADAIRQWRFAPLAAPAAMLVGFNPAAGGELRDQPAALVGSAVRAPIKIQDVKPVYPAEARQAGVQGVVILETRIAADGSVAEARILRSIRMLDEAALAAVLRWKFSAPGLPVLMTMTVNFTLREGPASRGGMGAGMGSGVGGGISGGVRGGVAGGVAGGVTGGVMDSAAPVRVGGNIPPPQKTLDVRPVYPQEAKDAGIQGVVVLEATIGPDGKVTGAKVLRSIPELDQAALDAVRQWEFTTTQVNGAPVPVIMTVTVNFTLR
jgi:TonB family protein